MDCRLSSYKKNNSLKELISNEMSEYWATDDSLPHGIQIKFHKLTYVEEIRLFLSFSQDDSYTPKEIEIRTGMTLSTMESILVVTLMEPEGLLSLSVKQVCFYLQIIILSNHQEGKDSHIRNLKIMESKNKEMYIKIPE
ncbi:anaphase-promoting complex subunit 10 [Vairimorpha necatrix]|uniref:Anaphase-promoting complex subunit 10 n=1 Tax=Vairimorpha necatrix TaxID=6039 RepID=A0AAX4JC38_9MICR